MVVFVASASQTIDTDDGEGVVPAMMYHDTPTVMTIETLLDIENVDSGLKACGLHHDCQAGYWDKRLVCTKSSAFFFSHL